MAYASRAGRARTNPRDPRAHAICDRCGFRFQRESLAWQLDWRGTSIQNLRILVCARCNDQPQAQLRAIAIPADPMPVRDPRPENYVLDSTTGQASVANYQIDVDPNAVMPFAGAVAYGVPLSPISVVANGTTTVQVTCSAPHGLSNGAQVVVWGLEQPNGALASGLFNVQVLSATAFTYQTTDTVPSGGLLGGETQIITAQVGVPYGYGQTTS